MHSLIISVWNTSVASSSGGVDGLCVFVGVGVGIRVGVGSGVGFGMSAGTVASLSARGVQLPKPP